MKRINEIENLKRERDNLASELATLKREWLIQTENSKHPPPFRPPPESQTGPFVWLIYYLIVIWVSFTLGLIVGFDLAWKR